MNRKKRTASPGETVLYKRLGEVSLSDEETQNENMGNYGINKRELRIIVIGKTGTGKSATGNSILGKDCFQSKLSAESVTKNIAIGRAKRFGRKIILVDSPGFFDTQMEEEDVLKKIAKCIGITSPGLHAILLVMNASSRFTNEEKLTLENILEHFGPDLERFLVFVFTRRDEIERENSSIDEYVKSFKEESVVSKILQKCNQRYIAFDNTAGKEQNDEQVKQLFSIIENLIRENGGKFYTSDNYKEAEMEIRRKMDERHSFLQKEEERQIASYNREQHKRNRQIRFRGIQEQQDIQENDRREIREHFARQRNPEHLREAARDSIADHIDIIGIVVGVTVVVLIKIALVSFGIPIF